MRLQNLSRCEPEVGPKELCHVVGAQIIFCARGLDTGAGVLPKWVQGSRGDDGHQVNQLHQIVRMRKRATERI